MNIVNKANIYSILCTYCFLVDTVFDNFNILQLFEIYKKYNLHCILQSLRF